MPIIKIDITPQTKEMKEKIIKKVTDELSELIQVPREFFRITINEVESESFGLAGETLSNILKQRENRVPFI